MPQSLQWGDFLHNADNKKYLIELVATYMQSTEGRSKLKIPFIITAGESTINIDESSCYNIFNCNHEEADYHLVVHAILAGKEVVIVSKDTNVLMLLVGAFNNFKITHKWFMKYDAYKFANIRTICKFLETKLSTSTLATCINGM